MQSALLLLLDLLIAMSLLWLTFTDSWAAIASTAFLLAVRCVAHLGLRPHVSGAAY